MRKSELDMGLFLLCVTVCLILYIGIVFIMLGDGVIETVVGLICIGIVPPAAFIIGIESTVFDGPEE